MQAYIIYEALDTALNEGPAAAAVSLICICFFIFILGLVGCGRLIIFCKILVANGHVVCPSVCNPSLWKGLEIWNHVYKHPLTLPLEGRGAEY
jgi:hypothetical protein